MPEQLSRLEAGAAMSGNLDKMPVQLGAPVRYQMPLGDLRVDMNALLGCRLRLEYSGAIHCVNCGRKTSKSFNQGYCYPCFQKLAQCDNCIVSPEKCHYFQGTCREPDWALDYCLRDHVVYLANASGLKIGITRASQVPTRWIDQGATQALPIFRVANRLQSGRLEVLFKQYVADRTHWQTMLKGEAPPLDMTAERDRLLALCQSEVRELQDEFGLNNIASIMDAQTLTIAYPVQCYPQKVTAHNFDKQAVVEGELQGIKGQYLVFDSGVLNIRKFSGYHIQLQRVT